jgi:hypothetical protein
VTRSGEYLPIGQLFSLASFFNDRSIRNVLAKDNVMY